MQTQNTELERTRLSLFGIKSDLRGLVEQRCDALDRQTELQATRDVAGTDREVALVDEIFDVQAELATLDGLIRQYIGKELEKIDSTAHVILDLTARQQIHKAEADRLYMIAANEEATVKRIKELVLLVMDEFGEKKLRGAIHDLSAVGNGGVQALTIAQPDLIPDELKLVSVKMSLGAWGHIRKLVDGSQITCEVSQPEPNTGAIRFILESTERLKAAILGTAKAERELGSSLADEAEQIAKLPGVPGCRLEPRGKQLRVR